MQFWSPAKRGRVILAAIVITVLAALLVAARAVLFPFVMGIVLVYLLLPAVNYMDVRMPKFMQDRRLARPISILLIYLAVALILVGFFAIFVPIVSSQISDLVEASGQYTMQLLQFTKGLNQSRLNEILTELQKYVPPVVSDAIETNLQQVTAFLTTALQDLISWFAGTIQRAVLGTINAVGSTVGFILAVVLIPFWVFYLLNDERRVASAIYSAIPPSLRDDVLSLETIVGESLGGYIRGQLLLCLAVGLMSTVGMLIVGVNFSVLLGTIAGITEIIPNVGPFIGAIPAVVVALLKSPTLALQTAIVFFVVQQLENSLLVPKVVGASVRLHPAVVMLVLVIGNQVAGIWGMVLGVPLTAISRDVIRYLYLRFSEEAVSPQEALLRVHPPRVVHRSETKPWQRQVAGWGKAATAFLVRSVQQAAVWLIVGCRQAVMWLAERVRQLRVRAQGDIGPRPSESGNPRD